MKKSLSLRCLSILVKSSARFVDQRRQSRIAVVQPVADCDAIVLFWNLLGHSCAKSLMTYFFMSSECIYVTPFTVYEPMTARFAICNCFWLGSSMMESAENTSFSELQFTLTESKKTWFNS